MLKNPVLTRTKDKSPLTLFAAKMSELAEFTIMYTKQKKQEAITQPVEIDKKRKGLKLTFQS